VRVPREGRVKAGAATVKESAEVAVMLPETPVIVIG
jgi:hypothetical protein